MVLVRELLRPFDWALTSTVAIENNKTENKLTNVKLEIEFLNCFIIEYYLGLNKTHKRSADRLYPIPPEGSRLPVQRIRKAAHTWD